MTALPRLRRHTDGRVAIHTSNGIDFCWFNITTRGWLTDADVSGDGWSELLVAELPEPADWVTCEDKGGEEVRTPYWLAVRHVLEAIEKGDNQ